MKRPNTSRTPIAEWADRIREARGLEPGEPFFWPRWKGLPDCSWCKPWHANPNIKGWMFDADGRMEPVFRGTS